MNIPPYDPRELDMDFDDWVSEDTLAALEAVENAFRKKFFSGADVQDPSDNIGLAVLTFGNDFKRLPDIDNEEDYQTLCRIISEIDPRVLNLLEIYGKIQLLQRTLREKMIRIWGREESFANVVFKDFKFPTVKDDFQDERTLREAMIIFEREEHRKPDPNNDEDIRSMIIIYMGVKNRT